MNKERVAFIAGFIPAVTLAMVMGAAKIVDSLDEAGGIALMLEALVPYAIAFAVLLLVAHLPKEPIKLRMKGFSRHGFGFALCMPITIMLFLFLLNSGLAHIFDLADETQWVGQQIIEGQPIWLSLLVVAILPAVMEELVFRGGILRCFEGYGSYCALTVSALTYALVCTESGNFLSTFVAGLLYGYFCYILDSIWPAMIAHFLKNVYDMGIGYAIIVYRPLGIWPYLMMLSVLVFAFSLYLSMKGLDKLIKKGKATRMRRSRLVHWIGVAASPGLWVLGLMVLFRIIYQALS